MDEQTRKEISQKFKTKWKGAEKDSDEKILNWLYNNPQAFKELYPPALKDPDEKIKKYLFPLIKVSPTAEELQKETKKEKYLLPEFANILPYKQAVIPFAEHERITPIKQPRIVELSQDEKKSGRVITGPAWEYGKVIYKPTWEEAAKKRTEDEFQIEIDAIKKNIPLTEKMINHFVYGITGNLLPVSERRKKMQEGTDDLEVAANTMAEIIGMMTPGGAYSVASKLASRIPEIINISPKLGNILNQAIRSGAVYGGITTAQELMKSGIREDYTPDIFKITQNILVGAVVGPLFNAVLKKILSPNIPYNEKLQGYDNLRNHIIKELEKQQKFSGVKSDPAFVKKLDKILKDKFHQAGRLNKASKEQVDTFTDTLEKGKPITVIVPTKQAPKFGEPTKISKDLLGEDVVDIVRKGKPTQAEGFFTPLAKPKFPMSVKVEPEIPKIDTIYELNKIAFKLPEGTKFIYTGKDKWGVKFRVVDEKGNPVKTKNLDGRTVENIQIPESSFQKSFRTVRRVEFKPKVSQETIPERLGEHPYRESYWDSKVNQQDLITTEKTLLQKSGLNNEEQIKYIQSTIADGKELNTITKNVLIGKLTEEQAIKQIQADFNKLPQPTKTQQKTAPVTTDYEKELLPYLEDRIKNMDAGQRFYIRDEEGTLTDVVASKSTFESYMKDIPKKEALELIEKAKTGAPMTSKQTEKLSQMVEGYKMEQEEEAYLSREGEERRKIERERERPIAERLKPIKLNQQLEELKTRAKEAGDETEFQNFIEMDDTLKALERLKKVRPEFINNWNEKYNEIQDKISNNKYFLLGGKPPEELPEPERVIRRIAELSAELGAEKALEKDPLTGVFSQVKWELDKLKINFDSKEPHSIISLDFNNLKSMNETLTQPVVDLYFKRFGKLLQDSGYTSYRKGEHADDFLLDLPNKNIEEAKIIGEEIRKKAEIDWNKFYKEQGSPVIKIVRGTGGQIGGVKVGVAEKNFDKANNIEALEKIADTKIHIAKAQGGNKVITELTEEISYKKTAEIEKALDNEDIRQAEEILTGKRPVYFSPPDDISIAQQDEFNALIDKLPKYVLSLNTEKYNFPDDIYKDMYFRGLKPFEAEYEKQFPRLRGIEGRKIVEKTCQKLGYNLNDLEKEVSKYTEITAPKLIAAIYNSELTLANTRSQIDFKRNTLKELKQQGKESSDEYIKLLSDITVLAQEHATLDRVFKTSGAKRITGQLLQSFKKSKQILNNLNLSKQDQLQQILKLKFAPDSDEFIHFTNILNDLEETDPGAIGNFLADISTRPTKREWITSYLYSNVLAGPKTQVVNFAAVRAYSLFMRKVVFPVAIGWDAVAKWHKDTPREFTWKALKFSKIGLERGKEEGYKKFIEVCKYGYNPDSMDLNKWEVAYQKEYKLPLWYYVKNPVARKALQIQQFPLTLLRAADLNNEIIDGTQKLYNDAYLAAELELKRSPEFKGKKPTYNEVVKLAEDKYIYDERLKASSIIYGRTVSMNMKTGKITDMFIKANKQFVVMQVFNPFPKIAGAITRTGLLDYSPYTFFKASPTEQQEALRYAKGIIGSSVLALGALLAANSQLILDAPKDEVEKDVFYREGYRPYSIVLAGKLCIPIRRIMEQLSYPLMIGALIQKKFKELTEKKEDTKGLIKKGAEIALEIGNYISDASYLQNVGDLMTIVNNPARGKYKLESIAANLLTAVQPLSGLLRGTAQAIDPYLLDEFEKDKPAISIIKKSLANVPGVSLFMRRKISMVTGKPIERPGGRLGGLIPEYLIPTIIKKETDVDRMIKGLARNKIHISPFRKIAGEALTKDEIANLNIEFSDVLQKFQPILSTYLEVLEDAPEGIMKDIYKKKIRGILQITADVAKAQLTPTKKIEAMKKRFQ